MSAQWSTLPGPDLHIDLDRGDLRGSLQTVLRDAVRSGRLPAGIRLPSTRTLAADLGVARGTVTQAYEQLVAEGYLTARQGSGTRAAALASPGPPGERAGGGARGRHAGVSRPASAASAASAASLTRSGPPAQWDFTPGAPDVSSFPRGAWLSATRRVLASCPSEVFGYGDPRGTPALRRSLAGYLGRARGVLASPDQIVVCSGYAHALALLTSVLSGMGISRIAFENPSLLRHRELAAHAGLQVHGVPVDALGIRVDKISAPVVVVTPAHQFPTGVTLDPGRRAQLADWARDGGGLVIEDDYDGEFRYDRQPVGAVQGLAPGQVIYAGTASKTLVPGLRLAWLALPPDLTEAIVAQRPDGDRHPGVIDQLVLADMIDSGGYDRHIRQGRLRYRARRDRLTDALRQHAPAVTVRGVAAGLHALVEFPVRGPREADVVSLGRQRGIAVEGLASHWIGRPSRYGGLVIGYARPAAHAFEPGLAALAALLGDVTGSHAHRAGPAAAGQAAG